VVNGVLDLWRESVRVSVGVVACDDAGHSIQDRNVVLLRAVCGVLYHCHDDSLDELTGNDVVEVRLAGDGKLADRVQEYELALVHQQRFLDVRDLVGFSLGVLAHEDGHAFLNDAPEVVVTHVVFTSVDHLGDAFAQHHHVHGVAVLVLVLIAACHDGERLHRYLKRTFTRKRAFLIHKCLCIPQSQVLYDVSECLVVVQSEPAHGVFF